MTKLILLNVSLSSAVSSLAGSIFFMLSRLDAPRTKGFMLLLGASALAPTTLALEELYIGLQRDSPLTPLKAATTQQRHTSSAVNGEAIPRRATAVNVATEAELKASILVNGSTTVITQNITLTETISILTGTIIVSASVVYQHR